MLENMDINDKDIGNCCHGIFKFVYWVGYLQKNCLKLKVFAKNWHSIIKSSQFHKFQINANLNQDDIMVHPFSMQKKTCHILLGFSKIYKFKISAMDSNYKRQGQILPISNCLVFVNTLALGYFDYNYLLVYNPIAKQCIKYDLQSSTCIRFFFFILIQCRKFTYIIHPLIHIKFSISFRILNQIFNLNYILFLA